MCFDIYSDISHSSPLKGSRWRSCAAAAALASGRQFLQISCQATPDKDSMIVWLPDVRRNLDLRHVSPNDQPHTV